MICAASSQANNNYNEEQHFCGRRLSETMKIICSKEERARILSEIRKFNGVFWISINDLLSQRINDI